MVWFDDVIVKNILSYNSVMLIILKIAIDTI